MSSNLNKQIADLERQLHEARELKYRLEDELNTFSGPSEIVSDWQKDLAKYQEIHESTNTRIIELSEEKESLLQALNEAKAAAENIDTINEELVAANSAVEIKQGALDEVLMSLHLLESKLADLEQAYTVVGQEHWLAQTANEYVGGLQKKIDEINRDIEAVTADLDEATERKYACEHNLFKAMKSQQQLGMKLNEATNKANGIIELEYKVAEVDEVLAEEQNKLELHAGYINQLHEALDKQGPVNESQNAELEACNTRIAQLSDAITDARTKLENLMTSEAQLSEEVINVLDAVNQCTQYDEIYNLEESFNKIGMTLQKTTSNRMILCRVKNNKIVAENVLDDFVFVGPSKRLHEGVINKIKDFVLASEGVACKPAHETMTIMNEDKKFSIDFVVESERMIDESPMTPPPGYGRHSDPRPTGCERCDYEPMGGEFDLPLQTVETTDELGHPKTMQLCQDCAQGMGEIDPLPDMGRGRQSFDTVDPNTFGLEDDNF